MKKYAGELSLLLCATVFGCSYIVQDIVARVITPTTFCIVRYLLGAITILPFCFKKGNKHNIKDYIKIGLIVGSLLAIAIIFQQQAASKTEPGKIGFITSTYIVMVPILNFVVYQKKLNKLTIFSIILSVIGLVLLCNITSFSINKYDLFVLGSAFSYAIEILYIDKQVDDYDPFKFTLAEFVGAAFVSLLYGIIFNQIDFVACKPVIKELIFSGCISTAIGYFLQTYGQKLTDNTIASMVMALESVIAVVSDYLFFHNILSIKELTGCAIMFIGVILCINGVKSKI